MFKQNHIIKSHYRSYNIINVINSIKVRINNQICFVKSIQLYQFVTWLNSLTPQS